MVESVITNITANPMPAAVDIFLDTPKNGQIPKNCDNTILLTKTAVIKIIRYAMVYALRSLLKIMIRPAKAKKAPGGMINSNIGETLSPAKA